MLGKPLLRGRRYKRWLGSSIRTYHKLCGTDTPVCRSGPPARESSWKSGFRPCASVSFTGMPEHRQECLCHTIQCCI